MSPDTIASRLLALPPDVRATLAGVPGPGWYVSRRDEAKTLHDCAPYVQPEPLGQRGLGFTEAWWPANPAAAVAAVLYPPGDPFHARGLYHAHELLRVRLVDSNDDHAAALSIIEAHVARSRP